MSPTSPQIARQGHRYLLGLESVLALESGPLVKVLYFDAMRPWYSQTAVVSADKLIPEPMKYFHGQIPS